MWRALRVGHGMVDRIDALTRLNRSKGTGTAFITHSLGDLQALPNEEDRAKARGFADRCAVLMIGACSEQELDAVARVRPWPRPNATRCCRGRRRRRGLPGRTTKRS